MALSNNMQCGLIKYVTVCLNLYQLRWLKVNLSLVKISDSEDDQ